MIATLRQLPENGIQAALRVVSKALVKTPAESETAGGVLSVPSTATSGPILDPALDDRDYTALLQVGSSNIKAMIAKSDSWFNPKKISGLT